MKANRNVYIIYFALCGVLGLYLLFSGGSSTADSDFGALPEPGPGAMQGGGGLEGMLAGGMGGRGEMEGDLVDSEFFNEHRAATEEKLEKVTDDGSPEILEPAHKDNPINPQTGLPYPDKLMKRFEELRKRFPGNEVIPRRLSPEDKEAARAERHRLFQIRDKVQSGRATEEEINEHFKHEKDGVQDRLEILEYIMERQNKHMSPKIKEQYDKILARNQKQMEQIENQRQAALNKLLE